MPDIFDIAAEIERVTATQLAVLERERKVSPEPWTDADEAYAEAERQRDRE